MQMVSVIIPTYDRDELLIRAVKSVLAQTYRPLEVIVIDDCSPTPVQEVLKDANIELDTISIYRHNNNKGGNAARKMGIELASGKYLAFLDDDDEWVDTKIEQQVQSSHETEAGVVYTGVAQVSDGAIAATKTPNITGDVTVDLLHGNFIGTFSTILMRQNLINTVGYPDEDLPSWHDWDYYLRLSEETAFEAVSEPLVRRHSDGQEQLSHDHPTKRDVTVPRFLEKHCSLADKYNIRPEFEATVAAELGWSAAINGEFKEARHHYVRSVSKQLSKESIIFLILTIGGRWTFRPVQRFKRTVVSALN
jgi:glycosyltransferase involved in cell wall biosynthesis